MAITTNVDVVKQIYAAFDLGDVRTLLDVVSDECTLDYAGPKEIPWAGSYRGPEGAKKFFAALADGTEEISLEPHKFIEHADTVVVLGVERARAHRTGRSYEVYWAHAFTVGESKVLAFRVYTDTAAVAKAFGA